MRKFSLKTKVTLIFPLAISIMFAGILFLIYSLLQNYIKGNISTQHFQVISILADELDRKLLATQKPLLALAHKLTPEQLSDPDEALGFLLERTEFTSLFDNGLYLFDRQGRIVAELPLGVARVGQDFSFRDYLKITFATKLPYISDPYISSKSHHHPAIMLTAPILDDRGNILAVLGGSIDLMQTRFLGDFDSYKFGKTGYMFLFNNNRVMISHPDPERIMKHDIPPGANLLLDRAINGFDGTDETVNSRGLHVLATFKHLKVKNWIIGANFPVAEAYEPIKKLKHTFIVILPLFSLAIFWFTHRYLNRFTDPVIRFTRHVEGLAQKNGNERLFAAGSGDEVAILGQAFNRIISQLDQQKEELLEQEVLYRTVVDFSNEMVFWITADRKAINYVSPSCQELTGYSPEEFYAAPLLMDEMIHPEDRDHWDGHCKVAGSYNSSEPMKFRIVTKSGMVRWVNHLCRPVFDHQEHNVGIRGSFTDITLWKQAEASIVASEAKFRRFFDGSNDAIFIIDGDGFIKEANSEACLRYGFSHFELLGMAAADLDTPEEQENISERIAQILEQGKATFETYHRRKHDQPLAVEVNASLIDYEGGAAILAVARDITARNQAAQLLHRQNEYLNALHDTTLGLISRLDVAGLLQAIVIRAGKLLGTEHCYVYLKNTAGTEMNMVFQEGIFNNLSHYPVKPGDGVAGRVWVSGEPFHVEDYCRWEGRLADRELLHAMAGVPLKVGGQVVGVLGLAFLDQAMFFSDEQMILLNQFGELASLALENAHLNEESQRELAERKKAEARLRKLSVAVEQSPASIVITDTSGIIEYVNPHFTKLTGYSFDEAVGRNPSILKAGETPVAEYQHLWETILAGGEWRGEFHNCKKSGELYWEQALIAPIRDEQGEIKHFIAIKENITEQKLLESQLRHSQKMEAIGQLAGGISHDFNNILAAIIGFSTIIQLKLSDDSPLKGLAQQITATAERGASLTQGLLAFSRKQASNPVIIDINEILNRVQQILLRLISEEIHLAVTLAAQKLLVMADSVQIEQILMNLVINARDALPGGGSIVIKTEAVTLDSDFVLASGFGKPGEYVMLTFTDSGQGMDGETLKHIFEPFYTTKELGKGTGLGLSIVYGIIKKQQGYITCHSTIGVGTTFRIYLPRLIDSSTVAGVAFSEIVPEQSTSASAVILVADDNKNALLLSKRILEEFGYAVIAARDGQEAVDLFNGNHDRIDLLILDVVMPRLNGLQVSTAVHAISPEMKILFCSGYSEDELIRQGGLEKGTNLLVKPFTPKDLLMKIREVLDSGQ